MSLASPRPTSDPREPSPASRPERGERAPAERAARAHPERSWRVHTDAVGHAVRSLSLLGWEGLRTGITFNPLRRELRVDPHPFYKRLRERDPFHRSWVGEGWVVSRYADVLEILGDRTLSSDERHRRRWPIERARLARAGVPDPYEIDLTSMLRRDPPDHTRLRALVSQAFTPRRVGQLRGRVAALVDELVSALPRHGELELVRDLAGPLPVIVIAELLGVPQAERERFRALSYEAVKLLGDSSPAEMREGFVGFEALGRMIADEAAKRRREPSTDLLSALVAAETDGARLSARELVSTSVLLLIAGHETTTKLIANAVVALLRHPEQLARLREEPARIEGAVEELLRFDGPVQLTSRMVTEDREVCGRPVKKGQQLVLMIAGANRDPEQFADPDRLDVGRENVRHLAFGHGSHFCLGAQLARLEAALALEAIVARWPDLAFGRAPIRWSTNTVLRGPVVLPLAV